MSVISVPHIPREKPYKTGLPPALCLLILDKYFKSGMRILDPFAGSREIERQGRKLGIEVVSTDIKEGVNCMNLPFEDSTFDGCFTHPPYWNSVKFTDDPRDLSRAKNYEAFLEMLKQCFREIHRVLKPNAFFTVIIGDRRVKGKLYPIHTDTIKIAEEVGFTLYDILIAERHRVKLPFKSPFMLAHDYIITFRK